MKKNKVSGVSTHCASAMTDIARTHLLVIVFLAGGCAGTDRAPQTETPVTTLPKTAAKPDVDVAAKPDTPPAAAPAPGPIDANTPAATPPAKAAESPASTQPAPRKGGAAPAAAKPPAMDLTVLEKRLKETPAIGVFTKLTLKNQVDDLLTEFKAYYQGRAKTTLAQLRQPYDQLILKVLSLLQDSDPPLARAIAESREAIWGILSDPEKFKNL